MVCRDDDDGYNDDDSQDGCQVCILLGWMAESMADAYNDKDEEDPARRKPSKIVRSWISVMLACTRNE
jgi:hypothetical protein